MISEHFYKICRIATEYYPTDSMIVAGVDSITDIYAIINEPANRTRFTNEIVLSILPTENSSYHLLRKIVLIFIGQTDIILAFIDMLEEMENYRRYIECINPDLIRTFIPDQEIRSIITQPQRIYNNEFRRYFIQYINELDYTSESDTESTSSGTSIEEFNEDCQALAPSREAQLERLANDLKIKLCEECLTPNNQACDCWMLELGESYFQTK